jgi:hypothetical protein
MYALADEVGVRVDVEYDKLAGRLRIVVYDFARGSGGLGRTREIL